MINITEIEQKKEYLKEYRNLCGKISSLNEQKLCLIEVIRSAKAQSYDDMPKGNRKTDLSDYMVKLENVMKSIEDTYATCIARRCLIETSIAKLEDGDESKVLFKRYVLFKDWHKIAYEMQYDRSTVFRIHGQALQHIVLGGINENNCS